MNDISLSPEISVLQEVSRTLVSERDVRRLLEKIIAVLHDRMGMLRGTITLLEGDELRIEATTDDLNAEERSLGRYRLGEGITGTVARTGKAEVVRDIRNDRRFLNRTGARDRNENLSFICVPLVHLGQVIGTLSVDRENTDQNASTLEKDVALLDIIANITADAAAVCLAEVEERAALTDENKRLKEILNDRPGEMIGNCREMRSVYEQVRQVAPSEATVLIRGASGTGKELVARAIQAASHRRDKPFVTLNCAALPESLVESELFGHEKGAFTDAFAQRIGRAEAADGGTLFLDEIGDLSIPVQIKLLRFLQERTFSRVGSNKEIRSNVRFIAATSRNLEELMAQKLFREDLYYRLSVFPITLPNLADRSGDVVLLAEDFIKKMNLKYGKNVRGITSPAVNMLLAYKWPGNVRELENCIERAVLTTRDDMIHGYNLPAQMQLPEFAENQFSGAPGKSLDAQMADFERRILRDAVLRHKGNRSAAGRELGVSPRMMNYRINRLGIDFSAEI